MKKGFTLVELLIAIAIMAILTVLIVPNISSVRDSVLEKARVSTIKKIESAAEDWAYDNLNYMKLQVDQESSCDEGKACGICQYVLVSELLSRGYLVGDNEDKTDIIDPVSDESMNNYKVCIRFIFDLQNDGSVDLSHRVMDAYLIEE